MLLQRASRWYHTSRMEWILKTRVTARYCAFLIIHFRGHFLTHERNSIEQWWRAKTFVIIWCLVDRKTGNDCIGKKLEYQIKVYVDRPHKKQPINEQKALFSLLMQANATTLKLIRDSGRFSRIHSIQYWLRLRGWWRRQVCQNDWYSRNIHSRVISWS
jgi:hypothetical protein